MFFLPFRPVYDTSSRIVPGAQVYFTLTGTNTSSPPYSDEALTIPLSNPVVANGVGRIPTTYLDPAIDYRVRIYDKHAEVAVATPLEEYDPYTPGTILLEDLGIDVGDVTGLATVSSRTVLAALPTTGVMAALTEAGREGMFKWDNSNLSYHVTKDVYQGIYVAPASATSGASGAWVRQLETDEVKAECFGVIANSNSGSVPTDNLARLKSACELIYSDDETFSRTVLFGRGKSYYISGTLEPRATFHLKGFTRGYWEYLEMPGQGAATHLIAPADTTVIRICGPLTTGEATLGVAQTPAGGSLIEGLAINQVSATAGVFTAHGIRLRDHATIRNCVFDRLAGDAIHVRASVGGTGANFGNANDWKVRDCYVHSCNGSGLYIEGSDVNGGESYHFVTHGAAGEVGGCGINDQSYIGCSHYSPQITGYGNGGVSYGGRDYQLVTASTTLGASTTPGTNSDVWRDLRAATSLARFPAWSSAVAHRLQCPVFFGGPSYLFGGYQESGLVQCVAEGNLAGTIFSANFDCTPLSHTLTAHAGNIITGAGFFGKGDGKSIQIANGYGYKIKLAPSNGNNDAMNLYAYNDTENFYGSFRFHADYHILMTGAAGVSTETVRINNTGIRLANGYAYIHNGLQVVGARVTGWTASTGTPARGGYAAAAAGTVSAGYVQAEAQSSRDRVAALEARFIALEADLRTHGLIGT